MYFNIYFLSPVIFSYIIFLSATFQCVFVLRWLIVRMQTKFIFIQRLYLIRHPVCRLIIVITAICNVRTNSSPMVEISISKKEGLYNSTVLSTFFNYVFTEETTDNCGPKWYRINLPLKVKLKRR